VAGNEGQSGLGCQSFDHIWCISKAEASHVSAQDESEAARSIPYVILLSPSMCHSPANVFEVLGAMSKALATIVTQPLIVAKVRLQSKPPPERQGKPFKSFSEILKYTINHEGVLSLWKGLGPQLVKAVLVQGLLMMTKERYVRKPHPSMVELTIVGSRFCSWFCTHMYGGYARNGFRSWLSSLRLKSNRQHPCY